MSIDGHSVTGRVDRSRKKPAYRTPREVTRNNKSRKKKNRKKTKKKVDILPSHAVCSYDIVVSGLLSADLLRSHVAFIVAPTANGRSAEKTRNGIEWQTLVVFYFLKIRLAGITTLFCGSPRKKKQTLLANAKPVDSSLISRAERSRTIRPPPSADRGGKSVRR